MSGFGLFNQSQISFLKKIRIGITAIREPTVHTAEDISTRYFRRRNEIMEIHI